MTRLRGVSDEVIDRETYFEGRREEDKGNHRKALFCYAYAAAKSHNPIYSEARDRVYGILAPTQGLCSFTKDGDIPTINQNEWRV